MNWWKKISEEAAPYDEEKKPAKFQKTIVLDFDGVLHSYTSGCKGVDQIPDPPVAGAMEWLKEVLKDDRFKVAIFSSRSAEPAGIKAMQDWMHRWWSLKIPDASVMDMAPIEWPTTKPSAWLTIDDRAMLFRGVFPELESMDKFQPWNKGPHGVSGRDDVVVQPDGQMRRWSIGEEPDKYDDAGEPVVIIRLSDLKGTMGADRVVLDFNPSNRVDVLRLKMIAAAFINEVNNLPAHPREYRSAGEFKRAQAIASTDAETGCMYGVKAATKPVKE